MPSHEALLIVEEGDGRLFSSLQEMKAGCETYHCDWQNAPETIGKLSPRLVIFNRDTEPEKTRKMIDLLIPDYPQVYWVLSASKVTNEEVIDYFRVGVRDFLRQPLTSEEFLQLLQRKQRWESRHPAGSSKASGGRVTAFFSPKGGVGVSFTAAQFAVGIARRFENPSLLVDLVLQHGNQAEMLDMNSKYTLLDLVENLDRVDGKLLEHSLERHNSGLFVLPCPRNPEDAERFTGEQAETMVEILKQTFGEIILDAGHEINQVTLPFLDASETVFLVTGPDLPGLCTVQKALRTFTKLGYPARKVKIILNRKGMKGGIDEQIIEKHLGCEIFHSLPEDSCLALQAVNQGIPLSELNQRSPLTKSLHALVDRIAVKEERKENGHGAS